jgi:hypothetical protein
MMAAKDFPAVFEQVKAIFIKHYGAIPVKHDEPGKFYVAIPNSPKFKKEMWVGGVEIKKNYVSVHLIPVYAFPELLADVPDALKKRMQGKSCFNFTKPDEVLLAEIDRLAAKGAEKIKEDNWV